MKPRFEIHRSLLPALLLIMVSTPSVALLHELVPVAIEPGDTLEQTIVWDKPEGFRVEIRLDYAPSKARLIVTDEGSLALQWETGPDLPGETSLTVQARNVDTQAVVDSQVLLVRNKRTVAPVNKPTVTLAPVAGQIVSAGRAVNIRFSSDSSDQAAPVLRMDRVPRNASLEKNSLGSYQFYWQTGDRDQGEHVFRVTASHPTDSAITVSREVTVVIGDPSLGRSVPAQPVL